MSYQTNVFIEQGGNILNLDSGGTLSAHSGAVMAVESGAYMRIAGQSMPTQDIRAALYSQGDAIVIGQGNPSDVLSIINQPANVKYITLSMTSTTVTGSFWLTSCSAGKEVFLYLGAGSTISGEIQVSTSGCTIIGSVGVAIASFTLNNSTASAAGVHLIAFKDNEWSIVGERGDVDG